jgi:hypothetical protein
VQRRPTQRPARSTLGLLLAAHGPEALGSIVADLADGAILDTRVLLAGRFGRDMRAWPSAEDRFASDLLRPDAVADPWLRALTSSAPGGDTHRARRSHHRRARLRWILSRRGVPSRP